MVQYAEAFRSASMDVSVLDELNDVPTNDLDHQGLPAQRAEPTVCASRGRRATSSPPLSWKELRAEHSERATERAA
jgi:hypothetical protein